MELTYKRDQFDDLSRHRGAKILAAGVLSGCIDAMQKGGHLVPYIHCCGCQKHLPKADSPPPGGFLLCGDCFECDDPTIIDVGYVVVEELAGVKGKK